jgi:hypothetical protein
MFHVEMYIDGVIHVFSRVPLRLTALVSTTHSHEFVTQADLGPRTEESSNHLCAKAYLDLYSRSRDPAHCRVCCWIQQKFLFIIRKLGCILAIPCTLLDYFVDSKHELATY